MNNALNTLISLNEIHAHVRRRCFPFMPDLYHLLGMNLEDGLQNFADIILKAKNEFEEYNPKMVVAILEGMGGMYQFKDNFMDYVNKKIPASDVFIKPRTIVHFSTNAGFSSTVKSASLFRYDQGSGWFECTWSSVRLKYFIDYQYKAELTTAKDKFTDDSGVYFVEDKDQFLDLCCYRVMEQIIEYSEMVQLPGFTVSLSMRNMLASLKESVDNNRWRSSALYTKWKV
jgi:hypothetical protein